MPDRRMNYETRMRSAGFVKVTVWASPECAEKIREMAQQSRQPNAPGAIKK